MPSALKFRGGTAAATATQTFGVREIAINTSNQSIHVFDGSRAGGFETARADLSNVSNPDFSTSRGRLGLAFRDKRSTPFHTTAI